MADDETAASSPASNAGAATGPKAPKDRSCPFCGQAFTSSSLGRHLDLYIKAKNPKPPDGIHDVEEIRKIRGGITRRQPRSSLKAGGAAGAAASSTGRDSSTGPPSSAPAKTPRAGTIVSEDSPAASPVTAKEPDKPRTTFNTANWLATGVINNLPPRSNRADASTSQSDQAQRMQDMRRDTDGVKVIRPDYESESMSKLQEAAELGRAAEMALREVLGSLEAAKNRAEPQKLFHEVDFFALSFPGLCLALLPAPGTLFSPTPFASADSWSLGPPTLRQYEALNRCVHERAHLQNKTNPLPDSVYFKYHTHLSGAWEHWQTLPESERSSAWNLEILRSLHRAQEQSQALRRELEIVQQRSRHLEAEYDRLSRCQLPREYLMHPPNTVPIQAAVMKGVQPALSKSEVAAANYDADALITKWRTTIRATARPLRAPTMNQQNPSSAQQEQKEPDLRSDMVMNGSVWGIGGPMPRSVHRDAEHSTPRDHPSVSYQTPPQPGQVISAEDSDRHIRDEEVDADGDVDDDGSGRFRVEQGALTRHQPGRTGPRADRSPMAITGMLNANGKRLHGPAATHSRANKVYRASTTDAAGA